MPRRPTVRRGPEWLYLGSTKDVDSTNVDIVSPTARVGHWSSHRLCLVVVAWKLEMDLVLPGSVPVVRLFFYAAHCHPGKYWRAG
jgi:hypothetical protein